MQINKQGGKFSKMVYEKYIKRNGKVYGPYSYKSVKRNGKVITEYIGKPEKESNKISTLKYLTIGIALVAFFLIFQTISFRLTGNIILDTEQFYELGEPIDGTLRFALLQGEFVPASSIIKVNLGNFSNNYTLEEIIKEEPVSGNFSIRNKKISGSGAGYGAIEEIYPIVNFEIKIISEEEISEALLEPEEIQPEIESEENITVNETILEPEENITEIPVEQPEENITEEVPQEEIEETPVEEITEEQPTEEIEEQPIKEIEEQPVEEQVAEEELQEQQEESIEEQSVEEEITTLITGEVIRSDENIIFGNVSQQNPFTYNLKEGESVELVSSSEDVILDIQNNTLTIKTDYSEMQEKELSINLLDLNIPAEEGNLEISIIYNETELFSTTRRINIREVEIPIETIPSTLFTINTDKEDYIGEDLLQIYGSLIINGTNVTDSVDLTIEFNDSIIETISAQSINGKFSVSNPISFEEHGTYIIKSTYNNITTQTSFLYLLVNETNETILEGYICKEFKEDVLWSSGYNSKVQGATEYYIWTPQNHCPKNTGGCVLLTPRVETRLIYSTPLEVIQQGQGYAQFSELTNELCNNPRQGKYEKYIVQESLDEDEQKIGEYCGINPNFKCEQELALYNEALCYGVKVSASQYAIIDILSIKYQWCWES